MLESSSSMITSPCKSKRKKMRSNQKSTRRYKSHKSPRKKRFNGDLEDLGQDIQEEEYDDVDEEEYMGEEAMNEDLIGDPVVPEIINHNFEVVQPSPKKTLKSSAIMNTEGAEPEHHSKLEQLPLNKAANHELREQKKSLTHKKELLAIKLRQKLKKLCKQQDLGNKNFRDITQDICKLFDKVRDKLDQMQDQ